MKVKVYKNHLEKVNKNGKVKEESWNSPQLQELIDDKEIEVEIMEGIHIKEVELHIVPNESEADLYENDYSISSLEDYNKGENIRFAFIQRFEDIEIAKKRAKSLAERQNAVLTIHRTGA